MVTTPTNAPSPLLSQAGHVVADACFAFLIELVAVALIIASWRTIR